MRVFSVRLIALAMAGLSFSPSVTAQALTPELQKKADMLVGSWTCTQTQGATSASVLATYMTKGKWSSIVTLDVAMPGGPAKAKMLANGTWSLLPDGRLEETVTDAKGLGATRNGMGVPTNINSLAAGVVGLSSVSTLEVSQSKMRAQAADVVTTCTR